MAANSSSSNENNKILRVGIIGCGEVVQVVHIPTINYMSDKFVTTYLCDVSNQALSICAAKVPGPHPPQTTTNPEELCASDNVDVVLIASTNAYHVSHALLALKHNKYCLLEKPAAMNYRDMDTLIEAEASSKGKVLVGYMRRYAAAFLEAVQEVGGLSKIQYARVRDIIGPNPTFVAQSATFPKKFDDLTQEVLDEAQTKDDEMIEHALKAEFGVEVTSSSKRMLWWLGV